MHTLEPKYNNAGPARCKRTAVLFTHGVVSLLACRLAMIFGAQYKESSANDHGNFDNCDGDLAVKRTVI